MAKTILIVEDNELNMKLFNDLLQAHGYDTVQTKDGKDAVELARSHRPDLIVMDIQMPEISGLEIARALKADARLRHIPIIAVTSYALDGEEGRAEEAGCDAYFSKPVSPRALLAKVREFIG